MDYLNNLVHHRETLDPTSRLPAEIILYILGFLRPVVTGHHLRISGITESKARPLDPDPSRNQIGDATRNIVAASHTCRRWRGIAVANSKLWRTLWLNSSQWTEQMVSWSKGTPVTWIQSDSLPGSLLTKNHLPIALLESLNRGPRTQLERLSLELRPYSWSAKAFSTLIQSLHRPALSLKVLEINAKGKFDFSVAQDAISGDILGGYAPKLRTVTIGGPFSHRRLWTAPVLRNISRLTLAVSSDDPQVVSSWPERLPLPDVLDALEKMEQLQELTLVMGPYPPRFRNVSYFDPETIPSARVVTLHQLSVLSLVGHLRDIIAISSHIRLPRAACVHYDAILRIYDVHRRRDTLSKLPELFHPTRNLPLAKIMQIYCARDYSRTNLCVQSWSNGRTTANEGLDKEKPEFSVRVTFPFWGKRPRDRKMAGMTLLAILDITSLNCVRELHFTVPPEFVLNRVTLWSLDTECYHEALGRFPTTVNTLVLGNDEIWQTLEPRDFDLLRGIRNLRLVGCEFEDATDHPLDSRRFTWPPPSLFKISAIRLAESLRHWGLWALHTVELYKCEVPNVSIIAELSSTVPEVLFTECSLPSS